MEATLLWLIERKALTLSGFVVVLLGAFVPWPSEVIAIVVVVLGALLMLAQIPFAMRAAQKVPSPHVEFPQIPSIPVTHAPATQSASQHALSEPRASEMASAQVPAGQQEVLRGD